MIIQLPEEIFRAKSSIGMPEINSICNHLIDFSSLNFSFVEDIFESKQVLLKIFSEFFKLYSLAKKSKKKEKSEEKESENPPFNIFPENIEVNQVPSLPLVPSSSQQPNKLYTLLNNFYNRAINDVNDYASISPEKTNYKFLQKIESDFCEPLNFLILPCLENAIKKAYNPQLNLLNKFKFFETFLDEINMRCHLTISAPAPVPQLQMSMPSSIQNLMKKSLKGEKPKSTNPPRIIPEGQILTEAM